MPFNLKSQYLPFLTITLLLIAYCASGMMGVAAHQDPIEMDTVAYLKTAVQVRETGGIVHHIPNLIKGVYTQATQHPLYILVLSPLAEKSFDFFVHAKWITFWIGFLFVIAFFFAAKKVFGLAVAWIASLLLVFNATFLRLTTMVACESLLGLFFILFWLTLILGLRKDRVWWILSGFFASCTFLTKSLGILCLPIFVFSVIWVNRTRILKVIFCKHFIGFFLAFIVAASPLFYRNATLYNNPLYSDSRAVMWVDKWEEFSREKAKNGEFGFSQYMKSHSFKDVGVEFWRGLSNRNIRMIEDGLKPLPFWKNIDSKVLTEYHSKVFLGQKYWALILVLFCGIGLWSRRREVDVVVTLLTIGIFYPFVAWYSKIFDSTPPTRLLYCALLLILIYSAVGIVKCIQPFFDRGDVEAKAHSKKSLAAIFLTTLVLACLWTNTKAEAPKYPNGYTLSPILNIQIQWIKDQIKQPVPILVGKPVKTLEFYLSDELKAKLFLWPKLDSMEELVQWIQNREIPVGMLDLPTTLYNPKIFNEYIASTPQGMIDINQLPSFFRLVPMDQNIRRIFRVYILGDQNK